MALPSINGLPLTLGKSGRTCLTPTFKTWVGATIKGGDFSDALTFTITTQPRRRAMALATRGLAILLAALCLFAGRSAWAATYSADVIDGSYRDCRIIWSGDRITVSFTVDFKDASGNMAGRTFLSRG